MNADDYRDLLDGLYGDPEPEADDDQAEPLKAVVVDYTIRDRVRLAGSGDISAWGWVTAITIRPGGVIYEVSWSMTRTTSGHYAFELEEITD